jgi:1,4-alpha-glucan branching enzyme
MSAIGRAVLGIVASSSLACATAREGVRVRTAGVEFRTRQPDATSVAIAGEWNGWSPTADPMVRDGGMWIRVVALPHGEHTFMYLVDGRRWVTPEGSDGTAPDGFGGDNGTVLVP